MKKKKRNTKEREMDGLDKVTTTGAQINMMMMRNIYKKQIIREKERDTIDHWSVD